MISIADHFAARRNRRVDLPPPGDVTVLTLRITLADSEPEIWRRVQLRGDLTLDRVHTCLQVILGWEDSHLHRFSAPGVDAWSPPWFVTAYDEDELDEEGTPESEVRLDQVLRAAGEWLIYTYDFGDDWLHRIEVEEVRLAQEVDPPALCLEGVGACPPEDVGGIFTWNELAAALRADPDPDHLSGELEQYADWLPEGSNPDLLELEDVNAELATLASGLDLPPLHPILTNLLAHCHPDLRDELTRLLVAAGQPVAPAVSDEQWTALLRPWQTLLDEADPDGIPLTAAGWIAPVVCERIWHNSGLAWPVGKGNREQNTPAIFQLREDGMAARLIRRFKGRLVLTPLGRKAVRDPLVLRVVVARYLLETGEAFDQQAAALALLLVAARWTPTGEEYNARAVEIGRLLEAVGWRTSSRFSFSVGVQAGRRVDRSLAPGKGSGPRAAAAYAEPAAIALARQAIFLE